MATEPIPIETPELSSEADVQVALTKSLTNLNDVRVRLVDRHTEYSLPATDTLPALKPDFVGYEDTTNVGTGAIGRIEVIGEVKNDSDTLTTQANLGKVLTYAEVVFDLQPLRPLLYAFLANSKSIVLFKFTRTYTNWTGELPMAEGTTWLRAMLKASKQQLGTRMPTNFPLVDGTPVVIGDFLGQGRSAVAYCAKAGKIEAVAKYYTSADEGICPYRLTQLTCNSI